MCMNFYNFLIKVASGGMDDPAVSHLLYFKRITLFHLTDWYFLRFKLTKMMFNSLSSSQRPSNTSTSFSVMTTLLILSNGFSTQRYRKCTHFFTISNNDYFRHILFQFVESTHFTDPIQNFKMSSLSFRNSFSFINFEVITFGFELSFQVKS